MKFILYFSQSCNQFVSIARVSGPPQAKKYSQRGQHRIMGEEAARHGSQIVARYNETCSGYSKERGVLCDALEDAKSRGAGLLAFSENRLGRDDVALRKLKQICREDGITLAVVYVGGSPDCHGGEWTPEARQQRGAIIRAAIAERRADGLAHGRPGNPGRDRRILYLHSEGYSLRDIANHVGCSKSTVGNVLKVSKKH